MLVLDEKYLRLDGKVQFVYISEKKMLEYKVDKNGEGHCYTCMGCRSFLTPYVDENGQLIAYQPLPVLKI